MAEWVKTNAKLQRIVGAVKDQFSTGKAIAKHSELWHIDRAVVRATNHKEEALDADAVNSIIEIGQGSRMRVSHCVGAIMERLSKARRWVLALKCLILIHRCLLEGGFMYQDQLSVCPSNGGHNYLNLSNFRDSSSSFTWAASLWIRKYARFIEQWIQTSRILTYFPDMTVEYKSLRIQKLQSGSDGQLVRGISSLYNVLQEATSCQTEEILQRNVLVKEAIRLVVTSTLSAYEEIKLRLCEAQKRASFLEVSQAATLLDICDKLSSDSMVLTSMLESVNCQLSQHDGIASEDVFLSDYDLMDLKQSFRLMPMSNILHLPDVKDKPALPWRSGSWNAAKKESVEATTFKARSSLSVRKLQG